VEKLRRSSINHLLTPEKQRTYSHLQVSKNAENKNVHPLFILDSIFRTPEKAKKPFPPFE